MSKRTPLPPGTVISHQYIQATVILDQGEKFIYVTCNGKSQHWHWDVIGDDLEIISTPQPACAAGESNAELCEWLRANSSGVYRKASLAAEVITDLERENAALRAIFPQILEALESGGCTADASVEFLQHIPDEVRQVIGKHKREVEALRADLKLCHHKAAAIQRVISGADGYSRAKELAASIEALAGKAVAE